MLEDICEIGFDILVRGFELQVDSIKIKGNRT